MQASYADVRSAELEKIGDLVTRWQLTINGKWEGDYYTLTDLLYVLSHGKMFPLPVVESILDKESDSHVYIQIRAIKRQ